MIDKKKTATFIKRNFCFSALVTMLSLLTLLSMAGCGAGGSGSSDNAFDFTITPTPGSQTVAAGKNATFSFSVSPAADIGHMNFSLSGLPAEAQAYFSSPTLSPLGVETLNISTLETMTPGISQLTITATTPQYSQTVNVNLTITPPADFTLSATPNEQFAMPGSSTAFTLNTNFGSNSPSTVSFSVEGLPSGVTASFNPANVTGTGSTTLTLTASNSAPVTGPLPGNLFISATDASGTYIAQVAFAVEPADFNIYQSMGSAVITAGGTVVGPVTLTPLFSNESPSVTLSATGLPTGMTASFSPATVTGTGSTQITLVTDVSTAPGNYTITIQGTDASGTNTVTLPVTVVAGDPSADFFLSVWPASVTVSAGYDAYYNLNVTASGTLPALNFTSTEPESAITPSGPAGLYQLAINTDNDGNGVSDTFTLTATGSNGSQSVDLTLIVPYSPPPDPDPTPDANNATQHRR